MLDYIYRRLLIMEMEHEKYASRGVGAGGLTTGIIGTALSVLNGGLGNLGWGGAAGCGDSTPVNRYELNLQKELIAKDSEIAYIKGREEAKNDSLELYKYVDGRLRGIEAQISAQAVVNAQITANLSCLQGQIATLNGLTKTVIPITSVCPAPMPQYNSWTAPTATT
jgi:hypothetical protein